MAFTLPSLPYATNALEPAIDTMTMEIHHGRHHKAYVDNLNKALEAQPALAAKPTGPLADDIAKTFGDFAAFQAQIKDAGLKRFGSGWAWLVLGDGKLQ